MRKREAWLDALRIVSAFLVIVNHTNSAVFQMATPAQGTWWLSVLWYFLSKTAVPVFVIVSGAVLLDRQDTIRKALGRFARVLGALLVFSYGYYLYDAWVNWGLWPRMADIGAFWNLVWTQQITDGFWYLYFYMGLMLALPLLQRMAAAMKKGDLMYLMGLCFGLDALWPLITHYVPALALPGYLEVPLVSGYVGLFFAGHWVRQYVTKPKLWAAWAALAGAVLLSTLLLFLEYRPGEKYWYAFMNDRTQPPITMIAGAMAMMVLAKGLIRNGSAWTTLGGCAFGIYLLQDWVIAQTETRLFAPLCSVLPAFAAVVVWEIAVFGLCLLASLVMKRIPGLKKLL